MATQVKINWSSRAEEAVHYLTQTDHQLAELRVKHERDKRKAKRIWAAYFELCEGSVESRKAQAEDSEGYQAAVNNELAAFLEYEKMRNSRDTAETLIEFWRSWNRDTGGTM